MLSSRARAVAATTGIAQHYTNFVIPLKFELNPRREVTAADHGEICNLRSEEAPPAAPSDVSAISEIPVNEKEHHMKKTRISPEKAAAMDQDAVLAAKLAEHKNRSAGSKKAWVKIHAKRAANKAAAEAARVAVSENPAQALLVTGPAPENGSSAAGRRPVSPPNFKEPLRELLLESLKSFKDLYTMIAQRQPQHCPVAPSTNGKLVNPATMEWLHEIHRELQDIAVIRDGMWQLKEPILPQFSAQPIENTGEPFLGRVGEVEIQTATVRCTPSQSVGSESKENSKGRKPPDVRAKEGARN